MTPISSDMPADALLKLLFKYQELYRQAVRRTDVPAANRHTQKVSAVASALAATPKEQEILESLLRHPTPYMRLRAAYRVLQWSPEMAIPVLGRLMFEDLGEDSSVDERIDIHTDAKEILYMHFNIRSFDRNDLIGPLKAYGVDLPYRDYSEWQ